MPELPEVETVRRALAPKLVGRRIQSIAVTETRLRVPIDEKALGRHTAGRVVEHLGRRGKFLIAYLSDQGRLIIHLGMSGSLTLASPESPRPAHTHATFSLDSGKELRFRDPRRFGLIAAMSASEADVWAPLARLGVEPLTEALTPAYLATAASRTTRAIKPLLMDNGVVTGIGNIYASEALHVAGVHPFRRASRISTARLCRIVDAVTDVLTRAISAGGTTISDFASVDGSPGWFQLSLAVYARAGEPCHRCGKTIRSKVQCGRSTYYCPGCQT
ncbi:MAG: bifunctional DNA-formamidopyrimidine glycosylase/DNA-(apurinic or apyrimidinic site) lyase [Candidatus Schekmanbacteria bacterium]|nr:bifunctional DNA-formamidopyrimidine glycosylase/DNA-(apurinic or apyrimidinic site) lyase [Candidatus Schekmanbacteria bacterium]